MTQRASLGKIQDRTAEVRDSGVNLGCDGAEGGSKGGYILHHNTVLTNKHVYAYSVQGNDLQVYFSPCTVTINNPQIHHS